MIYPDDKHDYYFNQYSKFTVWLTENSIPLNIIASTDLQIQVKLTTRN